MSTTTTTSPFKDLAASFEAGWAARPSLLEFCGVPENTAALRVAWYSAYRSIFIDFWREINQWGPSELEASAVIDSRVGEHVDECASPCIDSFLLWVYCRIFEKYDEARLFEFPDSRQYVGGPYDAMAQETA